MASSTPPCSSSPSLPPVNPFLVQAWEIILPLTFKDHIAPKDHLVTQACDMLVGGTSLTSVKEIISKLIVPPPPTPAQQHKYDATFEEGMAKYTAFSLCKW